MPLSRLLPLLAFLVAATAPAQTLRQASPWGSGVGLSDRIADQPDNWPLLTAQFGMVTPENGDVVEFTGKGRVTRRSHRLAVGDVIRCPRCTAHGVVVPAFAAIRHLAGDGNVIVWTDGARGAWVDDGEREIEAIDGCGFDGAAPPAWLCFAPCNAGMKQ